MVENHWKPINSGRFTTVINWCRISLAHPPYYLTGSLQISCLGCYLTRLAHQITHVRVQLMNGHLTLSSQARKPCHSMPGNHNKRVEVNCYESKTDEISEKNTINNNKSHQWLAVATLTCSLCVGQPYLQPWYTVPNLHNPQLHLGTVSTFSLHRSLTLDISCNIHI
jgi:hypothetical protein